MEQRIYAPGIGMHIACSEYAGGPHIRRSAVPLYDWIPGCWDRRQREGMQANTRLLTKDGDAVSSGLGESDIRGCRYVSVRLRMLIPKWETVLYCLKLGATITLRRSSVTEEVYSTRTDFKALKQAKHSSASSN